MLLASSSQIREADRIQINEHNFPGILLMEEAGRLATEALLKIHPAQERFLILAGPGNNGGDGLVIARHLYQKGKKVQVLFSHRPKRYIGDAKINFQILNELDIPQLYWDEKNTQSAVKNIDPATVVVDALLGTGIEKKLRAPIADIINHFKSYPYKTVAIDLPSGLDASSGHLLNSPIPAQHTLSFQLAKVCQYVYPAAEFCGKVHILDIGIWSQVIKRLGIRREILDEAIVKKHYRPRTSNTHKGSYGHVLVMGGSKAYAGAIAMTGFAALKAGAGLVSVFCPKSCRSMCNSLSPELICVESLEDDFLVLKDLEKAKNLLKGKDALIIGPGMGQAKESQQFLAQLLPSISIPVLFDADALNILASNAQILHNLPANSVLTPHPGEMKRLMRHATPTPEMHVHTHRLECAEQFARDFNCVLVLKGAGSIVSNSDEKSYINTSGNPGMSTAGSGDILSGVIGALMGQKYNTSIAAAMGVYLHGKAGDAAAIKYGAEGMLATDIARALRFA